MVTVTCSFDFQDGATAKAVLRAASPQGEYPVELSGVKDRLPIMRSESSTYYFAIQMRQIAEQIGARVNITQEGVFDSWAE